MASSSLTLFLLVLLSTATLLPPTTTACGETPCVPTPVVTPPTPVTPPKCPRDALKLGVCADVLGLVHVVIGKPPSGIPCCALLKGLVDLEAAACLCTAIKANILGLNLDVPVALSVLLSACQKTVPPGFTC